MTIGQLAHESHTEAQTIRYYERIGLLPKPTRTASNYRVYDNGTIRRLQFIGRAKEIGFSLNDIMILLGMADGKVRQCAEVKEFAETRLGKIRSQSALAGLVEQCAVSSKISDCPILESLTDD